MPGNILSQGFAAISLIIIILLVAGAVVSFMVVQNKSQGSVLLELAPREKNEEASNSFSSLNIENVGMSFEEYNPNTKMAGDFIFDKSVLDEKWVLEDRLFVEFGYSLVGSEGEKDLPEYTWHVPENTVVMSPIDGYVDMIGIIDWSQDYHIAIKNNNTSPWMVSLEHVVDLKVDKGDKVLAGQEIAKVSTVDHEGSDYGFFEMAVWKGGDRKVKVCPFRAFSEDLKSKFEKDMDSLLKNWEEYVGKDVYDESSWVYPGCLVEELYEE